MEILIIALIVSNACWMVYSFWTHAQHMRAYHWMVGFRPTQTLIMPEVPPGRPIVGSGIDTHNAIKSDRFTAPVTSNGGLTKQSPMTGMGELEP